MNTMAPSHSVLAVDVGGTKMRAGLVDRRFRVHDVRVVATPRNPSRQTFQLALFGLLREFSASSFSHIVVGLPGTVSWPAGALISATHLPRLKNWPARAIIERWVKKPCFVDNDVHLWTLGEAHRGAGRSYRVVAGLIVGTGVGGGLVVGGRLFRGRNNTTEFGHTIVRDGGWRDRHETRGHLEAYVGGWSIEHHYRLRRGRNRTVPDIAAAANRGDRSAKRIIDAAARMLAVGIANLLHTINPDAVVVGGRVLKTPRLFTRARGLARTMVPTLLAPTPIRRSRLGDNAPLIGAAILARQPR